MTTIVSCPVTLSLIYRLRQHDNHCVLSCHPVTHLQTMTTWQPLCPVLSTCHSSTHYYTAVCACHISLAMLWNRTLQDNTFYRILIIHMCFPIWCPQWSVIAHYWTMFTSGKPDPLRCHHIDPNDHIWMQEPCCNYYGSAVQWFHEA